MSERIRSGSAPQIQDVSGFAGEHVANIAPSPGHGTAGDQRITRAATDGFDEASLERAIAETNLLMCAAPTREEKLAAWRQMCALIDQRSIHRVRFMERMRNLA